MPLELATSLACRRCAAALERDDLRCPICGLASGSMAPRRERTEAVLIRCQSCRAVVAYSAVEQAPKCAYCGALADVEIPEDPVEQAQAFLPFRVSREQASASLRAFLSRRSVFRPADLSARATLEKLEALWWPAWVCNAKARVSWAADSDAGHRRSEWAPHASQTDLVFRDLVLSAARGLSDAETRALTPAYDLAAATEAPKGPAGALTEQFDTSRSGARRRIHEALQASATEAAGVEVPGSRRRNLHVAALLTALETTRYALPAYVFAYRYREKLYRVVIHGQDARVVIGKAPLSGWRVAAAVVGGLALIAALVGALVFFGR